MRESKDIVKSFEAVIVCLEELYKRVESIEQDVGVLRRTLQFIPLDPKVLKKADSAAREYCQHPNIRLIEATPNIPASYNCDDCGFKHYHHDLWKK